MLEPAVSPTVASHISRGLAPDRRRRRGPQVTRLLVPHIECLSWPVADRVVGPGRELVLATVDRPGVAAAFGRHLKAEDGIGDYVDPGRGRRLSWAQGRYILPTILSEAAEPVEELERLPRACPRESRHHRLVLRAAHHG